MSSPPDKQTLVLRPCFFKCLCVLFLSLCLTPNKRTYRAHGPAESASSTPASCACLTSPTRVASGLWFCDRVVSISLLQKSASEARILTKSRVDSSLLATLYDRSSLQKSVELTVFTCRHLVWDRCCRCLIFSWGFSSKAELTVFNCRHLMWDRCCRNLVFSGGFSPKVELTGVTWPHFMCDRCC